VVIPPPGVKRNPVLLNDLPCGKEMVNTSLQNKKADNPSIANLW
jgi:hypothetical protein